jgi:hypothetical protein
MKIAPAEGFGAGCDASAAELTKSEAESQSLFVLPAIIDLRRASGQISAESMK